MSRYAVLQHDWDGTHWDFLLEIDPSGPLRAWAIDEPIVAGKDLPARALVDHRSIYLDYQGAISGGRGTVRRVDRGEYQPTEWSDDLVRVRLEGGQLVGEVVLRRTGGLGEDGAAWVFRLGNVS